MNSHEAARYVPPEQVTAAKNGDLERWEIKLAGSHIEFALRHLVVQRIEGRFWTWGGTMYVNRAEPWLSTVRVWVDLASIETGAPERDDHIRSPEFLNVVRFPRAEFRSTAVEPRDGRVILRGRLHLHGVSHDLDLEVEPRLGTSDARNVYIVHGKLNRQAFGLHWNQDLDVGGVVLGDEVELTAEIEVVRSSEDDA